MKIKVHEGLQDVENVQLGQWDTEKRDQYFPAEDPGKLGSAQRDPKKINSD